MKVLVIDDDPNAQRILKLLLQSAGFDPLGCASAEEGLIIARGESSPRIIICDWRVGGIDAPLFCRRLREAKPPFRPFLYVISNRTGKEEIAQALDAGADDYLAKPFNLLEVQARLRAATRLLQHQADLQRQVEEAAANTERNQLLGEMLSQRSSSKISNILQNSAATVTAVQQSSPPRKAGDFSSYDIRYMCAATLMEMKLALEDTTARMAPPNLRSAEFCAWIPLLLPAEQLWMDLLLGGCMSDAAALFERSLQRKPENYKETLGFLSELLRIMANGFHRSLQLQDPQTVSPVGPRATQPILSKSMPFIPQGTKSHDLIIDGCRLTLTFIHHSCPRTEVEPGGLREFDYLGEALPPAQVTAIPLFKKGSIMGRRFVDKLREQAELTRFDYVATVHRPSPMGRYFMGLRGESRLLE